METKIRVRGVDHWLTTEQVLEATFRKDPDRALLPGGFYAVVRRKRVPVKWAIRRALDLPGTDFTTDQALGTMKRLGFHVGQQD